MNYVSVILLRREIIISCRELLLRGELQCIIHNEQRISSSRDIRQCRRLKKTRKTVARRNYSFSGGSWISKRILSPVLLRTLDASVTEAAILSRCLITSSCIHDCPECPPRGSTYGKALGKSFCPEGSTSLLFPRASVRFRIRFHGVRTYGRLMASQRCFSCPTNVGAYLAGLFRGLCR